LYCVLLLLTMFWVHWSE